MDSDTVSRHHARIERDVDGSHFVADLQSTNGTYVNDRAVERERLCTGDFLRVGDTIFKFLSGDNIESAYFEEIYRTTILDGLTQVNNKRYLDEFLDREFSRSRRHGRDLALAMFDIDEFKQVNDTYGHLAGDHVLQELASLIRPRIRRHELLARLGGDEFAILLPETTLESAIRLSDAIRAMVAQHAFVFDLQRIPVTISLGVAELTPTMERVEDLVRAADEALYRAKHAGRNTVSH